MIHSMSGGILSAVGSYTFVKVIFDDDPVPYWYVADFDVKEGDRVYAPKGRADIAKLATVVKVEQNVNGQVTPVPLNRAKKLLYKA